MTDTYIQKTKKSYMDSRARRNLTQVSSDLQDVQRIMVQNIEDVLTRGEQLSGERHSDKDRRFKEFCFPVICSQVRIHEGLFRLFLVALDDKASSLATMSQKYKKDAHYLNLRSSYAKIGAIVIIIIVMLLFLRYWIF